MALAIYRKYRPATFEDLLGQEQIVSILKEAAKQEKLAHAYLLAGPRGTGKTTTARLIAKIANCEKRANDPAFREKGEPCNECAACRHIDEGSSMDVIEIDAASNRGIDEMRNLKESVRLSPAEGRSKVFIIDEAHMLTKEAFNALLKTLEEPKGKTILFLCASSLEALPATIRSRCQIVRFQTVPAQEIERALREDHGLTAKEAKAYAKASMGAPGLALTLLLDGEARSRAQVETANFLLLLEKKLPDLCADRIDYSLRCGLVFGLINKIFLDFRKLFRK